MKRENVIFALKTFALVLAGVFCVFDCAWIFDTSNEGNPNFRIISIVIYTILFLIFLLFGIFVSSKKDNRIILLIFCILNSIVNLFFISLISTSFFVLALPISIILLLPWIGFVYEIKSTLNKKDD